ncbi:MAG: His/Gly/Thr/Pro-type tRNA ligase C-terminal domain-containing protein, partial [Candidatus Cloacimonadaceae bacterium]
MDIIFDILKQRNVYESQNGTFAVYLYAESSSMDMMLLQITHELHALGVRTVFGINGDELAQQMQRAKRKGCSLLFAIRDQNIRDGKILLYNLIKEHQEYIPLSDISNAVLVARKAINNE